MKGSRVARRGISYILAIILGIVITIGAYALIVNWLWPTISATFSSAKNIHVTAYGIADSAGTINKIYVDVTNPSGAGVIDRLKIEIVSRGKTLARFDVTLSQPITAGQTRSFSILINATSSTTTLVDESSNQTVNGTYGGTASPGDRVSVIITAVFRDGSTASANAVFTLTQT